MASEKGEDKGRRAETGNETKTRALRIPGLEIPNPLDCDEREAI
jgi:hypothetical protein